MSCDGKEKLSGAKVKRRMAVRSRDMAQQGNALYRQSRAANCSGRARRAALRKSKAENGLQRQGVGAMRKGEA